MAGERGIGPATAFQIDGGFAPDRTQRRAAGRDRQCAQTPRTQTNTIICSLRQWSCKGPTDPHPSWTSQLRRAFDRASTSANTDRIAICHIEGKDGVRAFRAAGALGHTAGRYRHLVCGSFAHARPPHARLWRDRQRRSAPVPRRGELHLLPLCVSSCGSDRDGLKLARRHVRPAAACNRKHGNSHSREPSRASKVVHSPPRKLKA